MGLLDRIKAAKEERALKPSDISVRGTGFNKKTAEADAKEQAREIAKSLKHSDEGQQALDDYARQVESANEAILAEALAKNIQLDESQLRALNGILKNQVCCLIGAAGTGKTTLEKIVIRELAKRVNAVYVQYDPDEEPPEDGDQFDRAEEAEEAKKGEKKSPGIAVAAFTGRAAQQSRKAIGNDYGIPIRTMHSLLGYAPTDVVKAYLDPITGRMGEKTIRMFRPSYGISCKLPQNVYIIDEASMMPIPLWNEFIDAIMPNSRIIVVGDIHQLPPVYSKSVLGYALQKWPVFELAKIHRQAEGNSIIENSQRILHGQMLKKTENVFLFEAPPDAQGSAGFQAFIRTMTNKLWKMDRFDPLRDVVIVPNSKREIIISAPALNDYFAPNFNLEKTVDGVIVNKRMTIHTGTAQVQFAIGDKVMMGKNINSSNPPITNGMMGVVERIALNGRYDQKRSQLVEAMEDDDPDGDEITLDALEDLGFALEQAQSVVKKRESEEFDQRQASHVMTIKFETGQTFSCSTAGDFRDIQFGYAITCHKAQGGEYPNVIIAIHSASGPMLCQEWLYTAFTRARMNVYLLYNKRALDRALKTQKIKGNTLREKIMAYIVEAKSDDMELANDPWNVDREKFPILFQPKEL